jgi:hypothetical protein
VTDPAHPSLDECAHGFRIDGTLHEWGCRFDEVVTDYAGENYVRHSIPCSTAYGFETVSVELTADAPDRPVTSLAYEIAANLAPKDAFARLVKALGQPGEISREDVTDEGSVALYASWERGPCSISASFYGAPRASEFGDSIGALYVSWTDTEAAAAPFLEQWTAANAALAEAAKDAKPAFFEVRYPTFDPDYPAPTPSERALRADGLLETPTDAAKRLGTRTFALWRDKSGGWYLSTGRDTVRLVEGTVVDLMEIAPARGSGYAALEIGLWHVRDAHGSAAIAEAARQIARIPGVTVERHTGNDV